MGYLVTRGNNGNVSYSGTQYVNPSSGTHRLCIRTGTGADDIVKYGLTSNSTASDYCGMRMYINGKTAYIGRSTTGSQGTATSTITTTNSSVSTCTSSTNARGATTLYNSSIYTQSTSNTFSSHTGISSYKSSSKSTTGTYTLASSLKTSGTISLPLYQSQTSSIGTSSLTGSSVTAGGSFFLTNKITSSYRVDYRTITTTTSNISFNQSTTNTSSHTSTSLSCSNNSICLAADASGSGIVSSTGASYYGNHTQSTLLSSVSSGMTYKTSIPAQTCMVSSHQVDVITMSSYLRHQYYSSTLSYHASTLSTALLTTRVNMTSSFTSTTLTMSTTHNFNM